MWGGGIAAEAAPTVEPAFRSVRLVVWLVAPVTGFDAGPE
jgi:hypothetical protein